MIFLFSQYLEPILIKLSII